MKKEDWLKFDFMKVAKGCITSMVGLGSNSKEPGLEVQPSLEPTIMTKEVVH